MQCPTTS